MSTFFALNERRGRKSTFDYIMIKRISFVFSPLSSFVDTHSDIIVTLVDMRKRTDQTARSMVLQDNKQYKGEFTLDYCFPKESASKVSMSFAQEVPTFDTGEQWGACQIFLELEESDYPQMAAFQDTIGMASLTTSALEDYHHNPAHINLAIRNNHRKKLQDMYLQGQIADETEPLKDRMKKATYARSSGVALKRNSTKAKALELDSQGNIDWSNVHAQQAPDIPEDVASIEPLDEGSSERSESPEPGPSVPPPQPTLKSAMKKKQRFVSPPPSEITQEEKESMIEEGEFPIQIGRLAATKLEK